MHQLKKEKNKIIEINAEEVPQINAGILHSARHNYLHLSHFESPGDITTYFV